MVQEACKTTTGERMWRQLLREGLAYSVVGVSSVLFEMAIFNALFLLLVPSNTQEVMLISVASYLLSSVNAYQGHRRWTFRRAAGQRYRFCSFLLLNTLTLSINTGLVYTVSTLLPYLVSLSDIQVANISKLIAVSGSGLVAFLGNKFWVFNR